MFQNTVAYHFPSTQLFRTHLPHPLATFPDPEIQVPLPAPHMTHETLGETFSDRRRGENPDNNPAKCVAVYRVERLDDLMGEKHQQSIIKHKHTPSRCSLLFQYQPEIQNRSVMSWEGN